MTLLYSAYGGGVVGDLRHLFLVPELSSGYLAGPRAGRNHHNAAHRYIGADDMISPDSPLKRRW